MTVATPFDLGRARGRRRRSPAAVAAAPAPAVTDTVETKDLVEALRLRLQKQRESGGERIDLSPIEIFVGILDKDEEDSTARRDERDRIAGEFDDVADRVLWRDLDGVLIGLERLDDRFHALRSLVREQGSCV